MMDNEEKIVVQKAVRAMAAAAKEIDKLTAERDALQAQVEALSKLHSDLTNADMVFEDDVHSGYLITTEQIDEMEHLLATPAACLTQVRAEAVRDFIEFMYKSSDCNLCDKSLDVASQYAESIQQEVK
jgi:multidrug resistance efflux pump